MNQILLSILIVSFVGVGVYVYSIMYQNNNLIVEVDDDTEELAKLVSQLKDEELEHANDNVGPLDGEPVEEPAPVEQGDDLPFEEREEEGANINDEKQKETEEANKVRRMPEPRSPSLYNLGDIIGAPEDVFASNNWEV